MNVYYPSGLVCPICENRMDMNHHHYYKLDCKYGCYSVRKDKIDGDIVFLISIFDEKVKIRDSMSRAHTEILEKSIVEKIKSLKKDYKYLAYILERM